ncbi:PIN domain nuclease [Knoellia sp. CPCC 206453]|uniref:type II toxin-antitoxin system VapC family toxin n=1 Tax=Knoellia pratensis TaxID=3404796 RepID=UPI003623B5C3
MNELFDTSVWIEFLRGTESTACRYVEARLIADPSTISTTEPVGMELLAGPADELALAKVAQLVDSLTLVRIVPALDFPAAAALHRAARQSGRTVRKLNDCLIAAVAIRTGATLVHRDVDFEVIACISDLKTRSLVER